MNSISQEIVKINFDTTSVKYTKKTKNQIISFSLNTDLIAVTNPKEILLSIEVDKDKSTLSQSEYKFSYRKIPLSELNEKETIYMEIMGDTLPGRDRNIIVNLKFYKDDVEVQIDNKGTKKSLEIIIEPTKSKLQGYEYLGYIGTNFDLVEGVQANDLFFAANILYKPEQTVNKNVGFYLSIYGNRAFSRSDSTNLIRRFRLLDTLTENTARVVEERGRALETQTTDNLGAYFSPLFQWPFKKRENSNTRLYLAPSLEFVYRRTRLTTSELNIVANDTITLTINQDDRLFRERFPFETLQTINEFSFNAGIGLFLAHETDRISVRVYGSVGYASNFFGDLLGADRNPLKVFQENDIFFSGRAWITEPKSGVTLQAEVTNAFFNPRPFFVATLSKAFDFKDLGSFFSPITAR